MKKILVAILLVVVASCKTENWAVKKINEIDYKHPEVAQNFCGTKYAPRISPAKPQLIKGDTVYGEPEILIGGSSTNTDTGLYIRTDTVIMRITSRTTDTVKIKIPKYIHDTLLIRDTVVNVAELEACNTNLEKAERKNAELETKLATNKKWVLWLAIGLLVLILAIILYVIIKVKS